MILHIHPDNPSARKIEMAAQILREGGVIIMPTDSVYAFAADMMNKQAMDRLCRLRRLDPERAMLSIVCRDLSQASAYTTQIDNETFRMMRRVLPGPYTFILRSNNEVPRIFRNRKKTIGIRIPNNPIARALVEALGNPLAVASLKTDDDIVEYVTDPVEIAAQWEKQVDAIIAGGMGSLEPTTIVDCTGAEPEIIREGAGTEL